MAAGQNLLDPVVTARVLERIRTGPRQDERLAHLTPQERNVLDLLAEGLSNREIGDRLHLAEKTIKNYVTDVAGQDGHDPPDRSRGLRGASPPRTTRLKASGAGVASARAGTSLIAAELVWLTIGAGHRRWASPCVRNRAGPSTLASGERAGEGGPMEGARGDRLRPLDSSFLHVEDGVTHMHIGASAIFEGPPPRYEDVVALIGARLPVLRRYRQRIRVLPAQLGRPVWVDDSRFNLACHVRHAALPPPGGEEELRRLMGELMEVELDRRRPLWGMWVVDGLEDDRWALIFKVHHCMADGMSGTDLLTKLLDLDRGPTPLAPPEAWRPESEPSGAALVVAALTDLLHPRSRAVRAMSCRPRHVAGVVHDVVGGAMALRRDLRPASALSIEGAIGRHRRWAVARSGLEELTAVRAVLGGTINDVVLAVITGAFRELLLARGDRPEATVLRSLVPVSIRAPGDRTANNQVAAMIVELPVHVADPAERLIAVRYEMNRVKASHETAATSALGSLARFVPSMLFAFGLQSTTAVLRRAPQRRVNTVTTNVPGPQVPLYALGREMLEYLPFVPIAQGLPIGTAVISYNGQVRFGVTGDYETVPELAWFCTRIEAGISELTRRVAHIGQAIPGSNGRPGPMVPSIHPPDGRTHTASTHLA